MISETSDQTKNSVVLSHSRTEAKLISRGQIVFSISLSVESGFVEYVSTEAFVIGVGRGFYRNRFKSL